MRVMIDPMSFNFTERILLWTIQSSIQKDFTSQPASIFIFWNRPKAGPGPAQGRPWADCQAGFETGPGPALGRFEKMKMLAGRGTN